MRFSIRTLFFFTTAVAVTVASLTYANPIVGDLYYTLGLLTIAFAILAAIYRRGPQRAFWVGFVVLFAGYFCHTVWPPEMRGTLTTLRRISALSISTSDVSTTRLFSAGYELLHGTPRFTPTSHTVPAPLDQTNERYTSFMTIGHTAIAFLLGALGGAVARRFALQSARAKEESTERATASPPAAADLNNSP